MDRPNIIYSAHNRPVITSVGDDLHGDVGQQLPLGLGRGLQHRGVGARRTTRPATELHLAGVVDDEHGDRRAVRLRQQRPRHLRHVRPGTDTTKGVVFLNGYLGAAGYAFSSPDHFDVNDVLPSQVPLLDQIADTMGFDVAFYNTDVSLPRQFWSLTYDTLTAPGCRTSSPNVPPSIVDPTFTNRTRSLILSMQNPVRPQAARADGHLQLGRLGEPASGERRHRLGVPEQEGRPRRRLDRHQSRRVRTRFPLFGLPTKYDFFIFSRDHYWTLKGASLRADRPGLRDVPGRRRHRHGHQGREVLHRLRRQLQRALHLRPVFAQRRRHRDAELHAARHARRARPT